MAKFTDMVAKLKLKDRLGKFIGKPKEAPQPAAQSATDDGDAGGCFIRARYDGKPSRPRRNPFFK